MTPDAKHRAGAAVPASTPPTPKHAPLTRRVRLIKTHIHAGLPHKVGDEIDLLHDLADWLIAEGAAEDIAPASSAAPTSASAPAPTSTPASTAVTPTTTNKKDKSA